jgi:hypothetical protein
VVHETTIGRPSSAKAFLPLPASREGGVLYHTADLQFHGMETTPDNRIFHAMWQGFDENRPGLLDCRKPDPSSGPFSTLHPMEECLQPMDMPLIYIGYIRNIVSSAFAIFISL